MRWVSGIACPRYAGCWAGHIECVANMLVVPSLLARSSETQAFQTLLASLRYVNECLV